MLTRFIYMFIGFGLLIWGAEALIKGATSIARSFGVSTLIVGLTVVAFGTSAPELFVSVRAALDSTADVAVGNIIGSNIFNILVIIGLAALLQPVKIPQAVIVREMPIMLGVLLVFYLFSLDGIISRLEGSFLFVGIILYLVMNYLLVRHQKKSITLELEQERHNLEEQQRTFVSLLCILGGLLLMVYGARWIVDNATIIARHYDVSELVIGITLVAVGTSLPEFATTIAAARKGHADLAVGNGIGSNIFNVLCVIGITGMLLPLEVNPKAISFDLPFMFFGCLAVWPLMMLGKSLNRVEGVVILLVYCGYVYFLFAGMS